MKAKIPMVVRILLGVLFLFSGIVGLFNLYPMPPDLPAPLVAFNSGLMASQYFFPLLKLVETICGVILISGFFVPLALVVLAPVVVNIICVHIFLQPSNLPMAIIVGIALAYLSFFVPRYSAVILPLFRRKS